LKRTATRDAPKKRRLPSDAHNRLRLPEKVEGNVKDYDAVSEGRENGVNRSDWSVVATYSKRIQTALDAKAHFTFPHFFKREEAQKSQKTQT
jgi:hypothetical protein